MSGSSSKTREPNLRASCDGCFRAKVKCSKERPMCSRCLTNGGTCQYSPSSRAGKPKASGVNTRSSGSQASHRDVPIPISNPFEGQLFDYELNSGLAGFKGSQPRHMPEHSLSGIPEHMVPLMSASMDIDSRYMESSMSSNVSSGRCLGGTQPSTEHLGYWDDFFLSSFSNSAQLPFWYQTPLPNGSCAPVTSFGITTPAGMASTSIPSPSVTIDNPLEDSSEARVLRPSMMRDSPCGCFSQVLRSLDALYGLQGVASPGSVALDVVLDLGRKARENCGALLACEHCMQKAGPHATVMVIGAVIELIIIIYRNASLSHSGEYSLASPSGVGFVLPGQHGRSLSVSFGAYTPTEEGVRQLGLGALDRELVLLKQLQDDFRRVENSDISRAVTRHIDQGIGSTLEMSRHSRSRARSS